MPRYIVERTFPDGLNIPITKEQPMVAGIRRWAEKQQRARASRRGILVGALVVLGLLVLPLTVSAAATTKCTPNNAPVGTTINVAMTGLPTSENVTITTASAGTILTRQTVTTNAEGNVSLDLDTSKDAPGDYTVQAMSAAGAMLTQGRYTLTAAPARLPQTGGGYAAQANIQTAALATTIGLSTLVVLLGVVVLARRRGRGANGI
jgi:hypothetical protein